MIRIAITVVFTLLHLSGGPCNTASAAEGAPKMEIKIERVQELRARVVEGKSDASQSSSLLVHVLIKGDQVVGALRYGQLKFTATDDKGNELKQRQSWISDKDFENVDRSGRTLDESLSPDTIRLELMMDAPPRQATKLAKLDGSVKLLVGTPVDVIIDAPADKVNKEIEDASLKSAGVKVMLMSFNPEGGAGLGVYARFRVIGKEWAITSLAALDEKENVLSSGSGGGGAGVGIVPSITFEIYGEKPLPEGAKLRLTVLKDVKEIAVPITLKDVELP